MPLRVSATYRRRRDAGPFGRLAKSPVACPDASVVGEPTRCEELGVDVTDADTGEFVPFDELEGFSWRGDGGLWQLSDELERVRAALQLPSASSPVTHG